MFATAAIAVQAGAIGDRFGRSKTLLAGIGIFAAGALLSAVAFGPGDVPISMLIIGRVLAGAGETVIAVLSLALMTSSVPPARIPAMVSLWSALSTAAVGVNAFIGGYIIDAVGWRIGFGIPVIAMVIVVPVLIRRRPQLESSSDTPLAWLTYLGFAATFALVVASILALEDTMSTTDFAIMVIAIVAIVCFSVSQYRSANPLIRWSELRDSGALPGLMTRAFVSLVLGGAIFEMTFLLLNALEYSPTEVGALAAAPAAAGATTSALSGRLITRLGVPRCIALACTGLSGGVAGLSTISLSTSTITIAIAWTIVGAGTGLLLPTLGSTVLRSVSHESQGQGSGIFLFTAAVTYVLGVSVLGIVVARLIRSTWTSHITGPCANQVDVLSDLGAGAFADIARTCGTGLGQSARSIYIDEATSAIQVVAVLLGALALTTLIANRRKARRYFGRPTS